MWEKSKETIQCDKRTITCDKRIVTCDKNRAYAILVLFNMTMEPSNLRKKKKIKESLYVTKELLNVILELHNVIMDTSNVRKN